MNIEVALLEETTEEYYYIFLENNTYTYVLDNEICKILGISLSEYRNIMFEYGAITVRSECFFVNKESADSFASWLRTTINEFLLTKKIVDDYNDEY